MVMKNAHIRILVIAAILTLLGIIGTQVVWLNRAIEQQDQVFAHNVQVALRNVVESLCEANGKDFPTVNPIEQVSGNYFIVRTNDRIDLANLEYLISAEIKKRAIDEDFEYGVYDCTNDKMVYAENVNLGKVPQRSILPVLENEEYYFGIYFPDKSRTFYAGFDWWKFTALITAVVILFFGYALFVILRQKRLSEVQKDFINNVSHELKTPLATLSLASSSLIKKLPDDNRYLKIINEEVHRLQKNVDDILHASQVDVKQQISKESIDLFDRLNATIADLKHEYASRMITWEVKGDAPYRITSNYPQLEKVIRNLVENAIKYDGKHLLIAVEQTAARTSISITDDGRGIPKRLLKKVFQKFYRVPDTEHQHNTKGFGLGLHIAASTIKHLNGRISVASQEGEGSTFTITIPNG